jgi:hypothetical protein
VVRCSLPSRSSTTWAATRSGVARRDRDDAAVGRPSHPRHARLRDQPLLNGRAVRWQRLPHALDVPCLRKSAWMTPVRPAAHPSTRAAHRDAHACRASRRPRAPRIETPTAPYIEMPTRAMHRDAHGWTLGPPPAAITRGRSIRGGPPSSACRRRNRVSPGSAAASATSIRPRGSARGWLLKRSVPLDRVTDRIDPSLDRCPLGQRPCRSQSCLDRCPWDSLHVPLPPASPFVSSGRSCFRAHVWFFGPCPASPGGSGACYGLEERGRTGVCLHVAGFVCATV